MADAQNTFPISPAGSFSPLERYLDRYGSHAFGVVSLLIIWFVIVRPELQANRATTQEIQRIADTLRDAAQLVNQAVTRMERIESK